MVKGAVSLESQFKMDLTSKDFIQKLNFYVIQVPCIFILMAFGFLLEALISLPFVIACRLDRRLGRGKPRES